MKLLEKTAAAICRSQGRRAFTKNKQLHLLADGLNPFILIELNQESGEISIKVPAQAILITLKPNTTSERIISTLEKYSYFNEFNRLKSTL